MCAAEVLGASSSFLCSLQAVLTSDTCRYGVLVFVVEMLGASTTLLYGLNLIWRPVNDAPSQDDERHGLTKASPALCAAVNDQTQVVALCCVLLSMTRHNLLPCTVCCLQHVSHSRSTPLCSGKGTVPDMQRLL